VWIDKHQPVEQMTWAPGFPMVVQNRLVDKSGWIVRNGVCCFNLYRPPELKRGTGSAQPWLDHVYAIYSDDDAGHIIRYLAHRVQRPGEKINHALFLGGATGIGKDTILEPAKRAVGPWNVAEVSPKQVMGRFNGFLKSVILRVNEVRDLGDYTRNDFYEHMKTYLVTPPDTMSCDEKNYREHDVFNVCGVIYTTNHKTDGIYLPADDRRHYVAWSDRTREDFSEAYWKKLWAWYDDGGFENVGTFLKEKMDLSIVFDPKAPPRKTAAFYAIVGAGEAPEYGDFADALDALRPRSRGDEPPGALPDVLTMDAILSQASDSLKEWLKEAKHRRAIPVRMERCGYVQVCNHDAEDHYWVIAKSRRVVYGRKELSQSDQQRAAAKLTAKEKPVGRFHYTAGVDNW
jgi:hypothetical protein